MTTATQIDDAKNRNTILKAARLIVESHDDEPEDEIDTRAQIFKVEEYDGEMFVEGACLVPESLDRQNDIVDAEEIRKAAYRYMAESQAAGVMHKQILPSSDAVLVESRVLKRSEKLGGNQLKAGSWVVKFWITNEDLKDAIRDGRLNGFSIGGKSEAVEEDD